MLLSTAYIFHYNIYIHYFDNHSFQVANNVFHQHLHSYSQFFHHKYRSNLNISYLDYGYTVTEHNMFIYFFKGLGLIRLIEMYFDNVSRKSYIYIYISDLLHIIMFYLDGFVESTNKNENDVTIFR